MRRLLALLAVVAVLALSAYLLLRGRGPTTDGHRPGAAGDETGAASSPGPSARPAAIVEPRLTPEARALILRSLAQARDAREQPRGAAAGGGAAGGAPSPDPAAGGTATLDKEYIRSAIRELVPLVRECYQNALRDQPGLGGHLAVEIEIAGEPEIGGVVTRSRIAPSDAGTLHAGLEECLQETMYGLKLAAPSGGGTVKVTYPFRFQAS